MSESAGIGAERTLRRGQHEPKPKPGGELEDRIETERLLHNCGLDRRWAEQVNTSKRPPTGQRPVDTGQRPCRGVTIACWDLSRAPRPGIHNFRGARRIKEGTPRHGHWVT